MTELTLAQVLGRNPFLNQRKLAVQTILNMLGSSGTVDMAPELPVSFSDAVFVWSFGAVVSRGLLSQDAMMVVLQTYNQTILDSARGWAKALDATYWQPPLILVLCDRKFVRMAPASRYYDLQHGRLLPHDYELPPAFEGVSYNLIIPVRLEWTRAQKEAVDGTNTQGTRDPAGRSDISHSTARSIRRTTRPGDAPMGSSDNQNGAGGSDSIEALRRHLEQADGSDRAGDD